MVLNGRRTVDSLSIIPLVCAHWEAAVCSQVLLYPTDPTVLIHTVDAAVVYALVAGMSRGFHLFYWLLP